MTNDEVERAIEFLLENQAAFTANQATLAANQATLAAKVDANTDAIAALTTKVDALADVANTALDVATKTSAAVAMLAEAQTRANAQTNEQIGRIAAMLERHITTGH